ncbi:outer membrane protein Iml2/Tetratricopeptide repeat protein 39 [Cantharellus anzutake]|uniref:outer membrane protein Iml2/Tetratricopeptide repeat protein 39 n=1 Tax=Cantharellus anzutake TaxID=1750568 RepID=UPI001908548C|nr:outer membrane protein Iml2/Tetratricopeptide repeat protein 39 [Cantharellus anzutake]KAF8329754.1 outer membrane protein Iml2/Tetratricopeptide repeat protein 39 [Cantharellus anzutake]
MSSATLSDLESATKAFDTILNDDLHGALTQFDSSSSPFHLMGKGVTIFLQAALGLETNLMSAASESLEAAEACARQQGKIAKASRAGPTGTRYAAGLEWDVVAADATLLLGLTNALSESYIGYAKCLYSLNSAHSRFTSMYKVVFPNGIDDVFTPTISEKSSQTDLLDEATKQLRTRSPTPLYSPKFTSSQTSLSPLSGNLFSRWMGGSRSITPVSRSDSSYQVIPENPVEHLIYSGVAFGYGLFNLVLSLLPPRIRNVVGVFGFTSDRKLGLRALTVATRGDDTHSQFAAVRLEFKITLMTYYGSVLLLSGYQADEQQIMSQYDALLKKVETKYPDGSLWLLNRRYTGDNAAAIATLQRGIGPERRNHFKQADTILVFELAWILLAERRYEESAEMFLRLVTLNNWSYATYTYLAAGCYLSLNTPEGHQKAQEQLDKLPGFLVGKKIGGKDLPTEVFIRKRIASYKRKQVSLGGDEDEYINVIKLSPAEELGITWNTHGRISKKLAQEHIIDLLQLSPAPAIESPYSTSVDTLRDTTNPDLILRDELAARSLLLGILHRVSGDFDVSRQFLTEVSETGKELEMAWLRNTTHFELAVLVMREAESKSKGLSLEASKPILRDAIAAATQSLDLAARGTSDVDLGSRLESRITMLRDELELRRKDLAL